MPFYDPNEPQGSFVRTGRHRYEERDPDGAVVATHYSSTKPDRDQEAFCTADNQCKAQADQHQPTCPVEQRLRDELGF